MARVAGWIRGGRQGERCEGAKRCHLTLPKNDVAVTNLHGPATERKGSGVDGGREVVGDNSSPSFQPSARTHSYISCVYTQKHTHLTDTCTVA